MREIRMSKSCDQCKLRKVRCIVPPMPASPWDAQACAHCINRNESCKFSPVRRKFRARPQKPDLVVSLTPCAAETSPNVTLDQDAFIDRLLEGRHDGAECIRACDDEQVFIKASNERVTSSAMYYFSEKRVDNLTNRLETTALKTLIEGLESLMTSEICIKRESKLSVIDFNKVPQTVLVSSEEAALYIQAYFDNLHPVYPFLNKEEFLTRAFKSSSSEACSSEACSSDKPFSALYHTVLALGSQYHNGGSFVSGIGRSWDLFEAGLSCFPDLIVPAYSLTKLQALTAMSIFALNSCCIKLDQTLIYEAARVAQYLRYNNCSIAKEDHLRTFWVIYYLEKTTAFYECNSSVIADEDIGCSVPSTPVAVVGDYDWFRASIRLARLSSKVYTSLFSVEATLKTEEEFHASIQHVRNALEQWRLDVPIPFRPNEPLSLSQTESSTTRMIAVQTQYTYYSLLIAVERLALHIDLEAGAADVLELQTKKSRDRLMETAQSVIEMLSLVDVAPHVPVFVSGIMPMSAIFILFDIVVHQPQHENTDRNLTLLDKAADHFSLIDMASGGSLPGNDLAEFSRIARQYVDKLQLQNVGHMGDDELLFEVFSLPSILQGSESFQQWASGMQENDLSATSTLLDDSRSFEPPGALSSNTSSDGASGAKTSPDSTTQSISSERVQKEKSEQIETTFGFVFPDWSY